VAKKTIRSVGLVVKRNHPLALSIAQKLSRWMRSRRLRVLAEFEIAENIHASPMSKSELARHSDLVVVLGGDGTLLSIARFIAGREVPLLGINLGGLGFLTEATTEEALSELSRVLDGDYQVDRRMTLEAELLGPNRAAKTASDRKFRALNDVVINKRAQGRVLELDVVADGQWFCSYRADGLIVATPTGSTAYALSAGGPIVFPNLRALVLAPICPHTLSNRPVVLPDSFELELRVNSDDHGAMLTCDGQESAHLGPGDVIRVHRAKHPVSLIRSAHPYFEIWRDKLRWG
jgi:NAD+ kinase